MEGSTQQSHQENSPERMYWQTPEYEFKEKNSDWIWMFGIISFVVIAVAIIFSNFLFAILITLSAFAMLLYAYRRPELANFELNESGLVIEKVLYPYASLDSFWVEQNILPPKLLVKSKKTFMPLLTIPLGNIPPEQIRIYLEAHLPEVEIREPAAQKILEHFGF